MSVKVETLEEKNMVKLTIEVPADELEQAMQKAYTRTKNRYTVHGFRKGKAPRKLIEKMYGDGIFLEDAVNIVMPGAYDKAAKESGLDIVSRPEIDFDQIEPGKDLIFNATVATKPEVVLGQYKGLAVPKADVEVTEEDIMKAIKREQEKNAVMETVVRPVQEGDVIKLDFEGFVDGAAFEGGKSEDYPLTIGSHAFIPGFEEQLIGAEIGKEMEVRVTFPQNYHAENLKGKPAVFKCTVKEIKEKILPRLDDEFASEVSEFETLEEYKADVKREIQERKERTAKAAKENASVDAAIANAQMEIPEAMIRTQTENLLDEFEKKLSQQGMTLESYMQYTKQDEEAMLGQMRPRAVKQIQTRLVLEAVAAAEHFEITEEELDKEYKNIAEGYEMEVDAVKETLAESGLDALKGDIAVQKAIDFLAENAVEAEDGTEVETGKSEE